MNIKIITIHSITNFGSALQTYALQYFLSNNIKESRVEIIDYKFPNKYHIKERSKRRSFVMNCKMILHKIKIDYLQNYQRVKRKKFIDFLNSELSLTTEYKTRLDIQKNVPLADIYITGSDQVWNTKSLCGDTTYLFDFLSEGAFIFSYASSFGFDSMIDEYKKMFIHYLRRYNQIGVREASALKILEELGFATKAYLCCDPTMLLKREDYLVLAQKSRLILNKPYILVYCLSYSFNPQPGILNVLNSVVKEYGIEVIFIGEKVKGFKGKYTQYKDLDPYDFCLLFSKAFYVVTSSFHGTAFSVINRVPFVAVSPQSKDKRLLDFLSTVGLENRIAYTVQGSDYILPSICYTLDFEMKYEEYVSKSINFINMNINQFRKI